MPRKIKFIEKTGSPPGADGEEMRSCHLTGTGPRLQDEKKLWRCMMMVAQKCKCI